MSDPEPIIKPTVLRCKVAVLGDSRVGKSALCAMFKRHVNKSYPKNYIMTTGVDFTVKKVPIKDTHAEVSFPLYIQICVTD